MIARKFDQEGVINFGHMAASYQVQPPEAFNFSQPEQWLKWIRRFERFKKASGLDAKPEEAQVNTLIYSMGDEADEILHSFSLSEDDKKKYATVKAKFDSHFIKKKNVIFERARFNLRKQEDGEPVDIFITSLYSLAAHCEYRDLHDELIRDRIVVGIRDANLSEKLQLDANLTLEKAVSQVRQSESVKRQQSLLRQEGREESGALVGSIRKKSAQPEINPRGNSSCYRCGRSPIHDRRFCPAKDATCRRCGKRGHYQAVCKSSAKVRDVHEETTEDDAEVAFLGGVNEDNLPENPWKVTVEVNQKPVLFHIDTGAEVTVISSATHKQMGSPPLRPSNRKLKGPSNHTLPVLGRFVGKLKRERRIVDEDVYVVKTLHRNLLGQPAIEKLGVVARIQSVKEKKDWIAEYPHLFEGLGKLEGEYTVQLQDDAKPFALNTPRRVAIPQMQPVKEELERMQQLGVIERVTEPTSWCSGMVVVPKSKGKVRICVDLTKLNTSVKRERHPMPSVEQILAQVGDSKVFTKLDANSGFWQIPLAAESALLTTFITPFGRFCFRRLPFGITSAPEHFQRRMLEILEGLDGVTGMVDDVLVHGKTQEEHDQNLAKVLQRLSEANLTLNAEKCRFSCSKVVFLGQLIDSQGIRPDPEKVKAIVSVPRPTNVGEIRRFLGMANQMSKFAPHMAEVTKPLRELLTKGRSWIWEDSQEKAFHQVKEMLTTSPILAPFDLNLETVISADASSYGLGAVLLQRQREGDLKPVAYISRSMTATEQRYAQIEKEALAFTWACERLQDYLIGLEFHIQTDHKPLVPLFSTKNLEELPLRVQRFRLRMMRFRFSISHIPGKDLITADMLSRAPTGDHSSADDLLQEEVAAFVNGVIENLPATEMQLKRIMQYQKEDSTCQQLTEYCSAGWPQQKKAVPLLLRPFYSASAEIAVENGLLMRGNRIIIPKQLQREMLDKVHEGHQGITKCRERAKCSIWWPGLSKCLEDLVASCSKCFKAQSQRAQPMIASPLPDFPWQKIGTDLFEWKGSTFLLVVDYYSRFIEIARLNHPNAEEVITHTKSIFARHGIPETVISDNGPQYSSKAYKEFAGDYGFHHRTSSPYYPQANGEAERAVGTIKSLLKKADDPYKALLAYRATPLQNGYSPSELSMCRKLRTSLPTTREQLAPKLPDSSALRTQDERLKERQKNNFDQRRGVRELTPLQSGDRVWLPDREEEAEVTTEVATRSYGLNTPTGTTRRNRRDLIRVPVELPSSPNQPASEPDPLSTSSPNSNPPQEQPVSVRRSLRVPKPVERYEPTW